MIIIMIIIVVGIVATVGIVGIAVGIYRGARVSVHVMTLNGQCTCNNIFTIPKQKRVEFSMFTSFKCFTFNGSTRTVKRKKLCRRCCR